MPNNFQFHRKTSRHQIFYLAARNTSLNNFEKKRRDNILIIHEQNIPSQERRSKAKLETSGNLDGINFKSEAIEADKGVTDAIKSFLPTIYRFVKLISSPLILKC